MILDSNILLGILALLVLVLTIDTVSLRWKIKKMLRNDKNVNIGESVISIDKDIKDFGKFRKEMESYLVNLEKRVRRSAQVSETVRFNAYRDAGVGGNQSFATAIVNENGDGLIFSSLYSRERVSIFSKQLTKFNSDIELSAEERRAVSGAKAKLSG
ncbi:MAG: DUF4446 family protein [bacterium]|nr:DUF4446 family protein [bacterium]